MLTNLINLVLDVIDKHAPVKRKLVKSLEKPSWLNDKILEVIKQHDYSKKQLDVEKSLGTLSKYRELKCKNDS